MPNHLSICSKQFTSHLILIPLTAHHIPCIKAYAAVCFYFGDHKKKKKIGFHGCLTTMASSIAY